MESCRRREHRVPDNRLEDDSIYERSLLVALAFAFTLALALTFSLSLALALAFTLALVFAVAFAFALAFALRGSGAENGRCGDCQQHCTAADDALQETASRGIDAIEQCVFAHL